MELHNRIEAMKLAYTDLYRYNADPRFAKVPVRDCSSDDYAQQRAALINPDKANCTPASGCPARSDTTYLAAIDSDGNIVSLIQSLYDAFGSGVAVKGRGFMLQDRGGSIRARSQPSQRAGAAQAALSYDHPGVHGAGRHSYRIRHHGRSQPAAGARTVCFEFRGLWNEYSGRALRAALYRSPNR